MRGLSRNGDFWSGLALAALGTFILVQARAWPYITEEGPGPGFFPMWYGSAMVVLSLLLVAGAVLKRRPDSGGIVWPEVRRALTCWVAFVVSVAVMGALGFMVSFALLTWFMALPIAIGGALGFYVLFSWALDVALPMGRLFS
jgi:putative tricarboxylic transport membrane protein